MDGDSHKKVAIVVSQFIGPGRECRAGINRYVREKMPQWRMLSLPSQRILDVQWLGRCREKIDGIILWSLDDHDAENLSLGAAKLVGVINYRLQCRADVVVTDELAKGAMGAAHLIQAKATHFVFYGTSDNALSQMRLEGFATALRAAGRLPPTLLSLAKHKTVTSFGRCLRQIYARHGGRVGVFAFSDSMAAFALDACHEVGLKVPDEVLVLGVDDDQLICESCIPPISSVRAAFEQLGYQAAQLLDSLMAGSPNEHRVHLVEGKCYVHLRESTLSGATSDPLISRAVAIIQNRYRDPIGVEDLVRALGVSRRTLEHRFQLVLGRSPYEQITAQRIDQAKILLANTDKSVALIASDCGFNSEWRLSENFLKLVGITPGRYRKALAKDKSSS